MLIVHNELSFCSLQVLIQDIKYPLLLLVGKSKLPSSD